MTYGILIGQVTPPNLLDSVEKAKSSPLTSISYPSPDFRLSQHRGWIQYQLLLLKSYKDHRVSVSLQQVWYNEAKMIKCAQLTLYPTGRGVKEYPK